MNGGGTTRNDFKRYIENQLRNRGVNVDPANFRLRSYIGKGTSFGVHEDPYPKLDLVVNSIIRMLTQRGTNEIAHCQVITNFENSQVHGPIERLGISCGISVQ